MIHVSEALDAMENLPLATLDELGMSGLVVVAPHPDDESLGCGGLIASARAAGIDVRIVIVSDGTGSHPNSQEYPHDRLRALRESEALAAVAELGIAAEAVEFLRLPDRAVPSVGPEADAAIAAITATANACNASHMAVTWQHDPHRDHRATFALAVAAARQRGNVRLLEYPIWGFTLPPDDVLDDGPLRGFRFDMEDHLPAKRHAIAAHKSQISRMISDDPHGFMLSPADLARFNRSFEIYLDVNP